MHTSQFEFHHPATGSSYVDPVALSETLVRNISDNKMMLLSGMRKSGKTSLLRHLMSANLPFAVRYAYMDMFDVRSEEDFCSRYATRVLQLLSGRWEQWMDFARKHFLRTAPRFFVGTDPAVDFRLIFDKQDIPLAYDEIFALAQRVSQEVGSKVVVVIEEFQILKFFKDQNQLLKTFKTHLGMAQNITYLFSAADPEWVDNSLMAPRAPLRNLISKIEIGPMDDAAWKSFLIKGFQITAKKLNPENAALLIEMAGSQPYYIQMLATYSWMFASFECTSDTIHQAYDWLYGLQKAHYKTLADGLTTYQLNFLLAMAHGEMHLSSFDVLHKYRLGTPGNIKKLREALLARGLITKKGKGLLIADPLFVHWLLQTYMV